MERDLRIAAAVTVSKYRGNRLRIVIRPLALHRRARRHPQVLIGVVAASAIVIGASTMAYAARVDAETRAELRTSFTLASSELAWVVDRRGSAEAAAAEAEECVRTRSALVQPAIDASARFSAGAMARSATIVSVASVYATPPAEASISTVSEETTSVATPARDAGVDELNAALATSRDLREEIGASARAAELEARERDAACDAAERALDAVLAEIAPHTDSVIAGSGMAATDAVSELTAARDAVLAVSGEGTGAGALPRWVSAAGAVEESHRIANEAAIAAAEAAAAAERAAAERATVVSPRMARPSPPILFPFPYFTMPAPDYDRMCQTDGAFCELAPNYVPPAEPVPQLPEYPFFY